MALLQGALTAVRKVGKRAQSNRGPDYSIFFSIRIVDRLSAESCCGVEARVTNMRMEFSDLVNSYRDF